MGLEDFNIFSEIGWKYNNFFYEHCEHVVSPSINARAELIRQGIPKEKISVIPNPVPKKEKGPNISMDMLPETRNIIFSVGRLSKEKSFDVCVRTIALVSRKIPDVCWVLVGDGPERENLENLADELGIKKNVLFLGKIPHNELLHSDLFKRSKFFLTASTTENQPVTIIEAMSFGLPIV